MINTDRTEQTSTKNETKQIKCPLCKRRNFNETDKEYIEHTGRCFKCDFNIHLEDMRRDYYAFMKEGENEE
jgi:protein-disulfide isomerase